MCSAIVTTSYNALAQNAHQDFLDVHNAARAEVGVDPMAWNGTVESYAQNYAIQRIKDCKMEHSGGPYGENLAENYGDMNGSDAVKFWLTEKPNYDYASNKCVNDECLHYTQIVWRDSVQLGCARAKCLCFVMASSIPFILQVSQAQDAAQVFFVRTHNEARAQVGVGPITWDERVASYARNYLNQLKGSCQMVHSHGPYGENLAWGYPDVSGRQAMDMWVGEKRFYDYGSNSCVGGECRHYTQVVWRNSVRLGCAKVKCDNNGGSLISCNYDPPGNYIGQRPYDMGPLLQVPLSFKKDN
ncbi:pathogenesis-related protein 1 [Senna tora]|uniref:Pathogenesis-related protein 1 n=1 Tax=Senna tora TaxID=362788 RepID=A0A834SSU1_9FABA|nr:pathogenesis-related protein 1 [Senna tora]